MYSTSILRKRKTSLPVSYSVMSGRISASTLGRADAMLTENEQVKGEVFKPTERIKLYVVEVKNTPKGPKITGAPVHIRNW